MERRAQGLGADLGASVPVSPRREDAHLRSSARMDVAAIHGERFRQSGYGLTVDSLPREADDIAVFAGSTVTRGFVPGKVVRVSGRWGIRAGRSRRRCRA